MQLIVQLIDPKRKQRPCLCLCSYYAKWTQNLSEIYKEGNLELNTFSISVITMIVIFIIFIFEVVIIWKTQEWGKRVSFMPFLEIQEKKTQLGGGAWF